MNDAKRGELVEILAKHGYCTDMVDAILRDDIGPSELLCRVKLGSLGRTHGIRKVKP